MPSQASSQRLRNINACHFTVDPKFYQHLGVETAASGANLNDESMMTFSQSTDSIHTTGESVEGDALEHQVRTLFVSGLPLDTKSRELYLLFRGFKGYLSCTLKPAGKNGKLTAPVGFITFETREQAELALNELQGIKFDPEGSQHIRLEFARSNTKVTKPKWTLGFPNGFSFIPATGSPADLSPVGQHSGFPTTLTPNLLAHLAGLDPTMALFAARNSSQWPSIAHFGYDNAGLYASLVATSTPLLQASNFNPILPINTSVAPSVTQSGASQMANHLQLMQAALRASNATAALGIIATGGSNEGVRLQQTTSKTSPQSTSPTVSVISSGSHSKITYSTPQNHQQQFLTATSTNQHPIHQAALVAAAAASFGIPAGLLSGVLGGLAVNSDLKGEPVSIPF